MPDIILEITSQTFPATLPGRPEQLICSRTPRCGKAAAPHLVSWSGFCPGCQASSHKPMAIEVFQGHGRWRFQRSSYSGALPDVQGWSVGKKQQFWYFLSFDGMMARNLWTMFSNLRAGMEDILTKEKHNTKYAHTRTQPPPDRSRGGGPTDCHH